MMLNLVSSEPNYVNLLSDMEAILYIGTAQSLFASFILLTKRPKTISDKILVVWFFIIALGLGKSLLHRLDLVNIPSASLIFTYGPLLYLYVSSVIKENFRFKPIYTLHLIPFVLFALLAYATEWARFSINGNASEGYILLFGVVFLSTLTYYIYKVFRMLKKHSANIDNTFSYHSQHINLNWVKYISIVFTITFAFTVLYGMLRKYADVYIIDPGFITSTGFTLLAFSFSFFAFKQPQIFNVNRRDVRYEYDLPLKPKQENKYERSGLKDDEADRYLKRLIEYTEINKPYLKGDLTIQEIADNIDVPKHYLTQILNEKIRKNFYTFINEYRVAAVKEMFANSNYNHYTLLAIAYECGFNSKSSFNGIFKKMTGQTPSEYRTAIGI